MDKSEGGGDDIILAEAAKRIANVIGLPANQVVLTRNGTGSGVHLAGLERLQWEDATDALVFKGMKIGHCESPAELRGSSPPYSFGIDKTPEQVIELLPAIARRIT